MTWFQDSSNENWLNSQQISRAYVDGSGSAWFIIFATPSGTVTYGDSYTTEELAETALSTLAVTFSV